MQLSYHLTDGAVKRISREDQRHRSHFELEGDTRFSLDVLLPVVMLENKVKKESLRWAVELMLREMRDPQPGSTLIAQQVAYTLLVEAFRLYPADQLQRGTRCLFALAVRSNCRAVAMPPDARISL